WRRFDNPETLLSRGGRVVEISPTHYKVRGQPIRGTGVCKLLRRAEQGRAVRHPVTCRRAS
ncbi:MAG: hypothetical protein E5X18_27670, partial [Mesorhizobium sp.]